MERTRILEQYNGRKLTWLHDSLHFIVLLAALILLFRFGIGLSVVGGDSMAPTFNDGDIVLYLRPVNDYRAGDVVSLWVPSGDYYIKRVIAAGGDVVELEDGSVLVNGVAAEDSFAFGSTLEETGAVIYPYRVREGSVFVLGDNREVSMDSRAFGEVGLRQIRGRIILQIGKDGIHVIGRGSGT